ncbi:MAG TPA: hypothetical protein VLU25_05195 [Acidobacteriota bacterium]|nr:hypothetical protein [Acidobacteriota bacterium]
MLPLLFLFFSPVLAEWSEEGAKSQDLVRKLEMLEERIRQLEGELAELKAEKAGREGGKEEAQPPQSVAGTEEEQDQELPMAEVLPTDEGVIAYESSEVRMPYSGYMEFHFNKPESQPGIADFHRFVLLYGHQFTDRIRFWGELELEHAFVEGAERSGELELEQAYLDFAVKPWLNFRAGVLLAPVGLINERHEPPTFNGVERPFVDTFIIPTTWFDPGVGIHGDLGKGFVYRAYVMSPLNASFISAEEGLAEAPQKAFESVSENPGFTGRLEYHGLPGLLLGTSFWTSQAGFETPGINPRVDIFEFDGRLDMGRFGFRGQFAHVNISDTARLNSRLQLTTGVNPNIAEQMRGFYLEGAAQVLPSFWRQELVFFHRYENFNTQHKMAEGFLPLGEFDRDAFVTGFTFFPDPDVALKFDYTVLRNESRFIKARNVLNFGIGWWF